VNPLHESHPTEYGTGFREGYEAGSGTCADELDAAESRIAAALACHAESFVPTTSNIAVHAGDRYCAGCLCSWDTEVDRCTSPTVTALLGDDG